MCTCASEDRVLWISVFKERQRENLSKMYFFLSTSAHNFVDHLVTKSRQNDRCGVLRKFFFRSAQVLLRYLQKGAKQYWSKPLFRLGTTFRLPPSPFLPAIIQIRSKVPSPQLLCHAHSHSAWRWRQPLGPNLQFFLFQRFSDFLILQTAMGMCVVVATQIETFGPYSGAVMNPAVTLALVIARKISILKGESNGNSYMKSRVVSFWPSSLRRRGLIQRSVFFHCRRPVCCCTVRRSHSRSRNRPMVRRQFSIRSIGNWSYISNATLSRKYITRFNKFKRTFTDCQLHPKKKTISFLDAKTSQDF